MRKNKLYTNCLIEPRVRGLKREGFFESKGERGVTTEETNGKGCFLPFNGATPKPRIRGGRGERRGMLRTSYWWEP